MLYEVRLRIGQVEFHVGQGCVMRVFFQYHSLDELFLQGIGGRGEFLLVEFDCALLKAQAHFQSFQVGRSCLHVGSQLADAFFEKLLEIFVLQLVFFPLACPGFSALE